MQRCPWAKTDLYVQYHDTEWGVPVHDDRLLFEFLILEGAQAGLSWETILNKRENYRQAFDQFEPAIVAKYGQRKRKSLLSETGIVRNQLKIEAAIHNAKMFLAVQLEFGTFDEYLWGFVGKVPKQNAWKSSKEVPARTPESDALSKDLKRRGFKFVGSTICYAFMQAVGMVNDHLVECFQHGQLSRKARKPKSKEPSGNAWFVYILRCADGSLYTGITNDVKRRCQQHNDGIASRYTRTRLPTKLVWHEAHLNRSSALKREAAIKAMTRREKLAMIRLKTKAG
jgi:DNA-3-methyladenine glycosylase I